MNDLLARYQISLRIMTRMMQHLGVTVDVLRQGS